MLLNDALVYLHEELKDYINRYFGSWHCVTLAGSYLKILDPFRKEDQKKSITKWDQSVDIFTRIIFPERVEGWARCSRVILTFQSSHQSNLFSCLCWRKIRLFLASDSIKGRRFRHYISHHKASKSHTITYYVSVNVYFSSLVTWTIL